MLRHFKKISEHFRCNQPFDGDQPTASNFSPDCFENFNSLFGVITEVIVSLLQKLLEVGMGFAEYTLNKRKRSGTESSHLGRFDVVHVVLASSRISGLQYRLTMLEELVETLE